MKPATKSRFLSGLAIAYSLLLFFIASYLPLITNGLAQILTWVVYSQLVRGLVTFLGAVLAFVLFIRWPQLPARRWFLAQLALFASISAPLLMRLGDSVNEYIHYPQYATCVLLWHAALRQNGREGTPRIPLIAPLARRFGPLAAALAVSMVLGLAEECYQYFAPRRRFDLQDIALNMMGVWLGAILVWLIDSRQESQTLSTGNMVASREPGI